MALATHHGIRVVQRTICGSSSSTQQLQQTPHLFQINSLKSASGSAQYVFTEDPYETPKLTLSTLVKELEVLYELLVGFDNLKIMDLIF